MKSFGNVVGRESGIGGSTGFMFYLKKKRIGRRRDFGIEIMIVREIEVTCLVFFLGFVSIELVSFFFFVIRIFIVIVINWIIWFV